MRTHVTCPRCNREQLTTGDYTFRCCGIEFLIKDCLTAWNGKTMHQNTEKLQKFTKNSVQKNGKRPKIIQIMADGGDNDSK